MLDAAGCVAKLNRIADDVLIFQYDVKPGDYIADEILRAEAHGDAGEAGERQSGSRVDSEKIERGDQRNHPDDFADGAVEDAGEGPRLLLAHLRRARLAAGRLDDQLRENFQEAIDQKRKKEDAEKMERGGERDAGKKIENAGHRYFARRV